MRRGGLASLSLLIVLLLVGRADAQSAAASDAEVQARAAFERGRTLYDHGSFVQAAEAFEEAYRLSGRDALLYNIYLAHRDANQQEQAAGALRQYLERVPNIENRAQLEARLVALEQGLERERQEREREATAAPSAPAVVAPPVSDEPAAPPPSRSGARIAGISLVAVGGAMALTSIATGVMASGRESDLEHACPNRVCSDPGLRDKKESGERLARATDALLFGGVALAVGGGVLWLLSAKRGRTSESAARADVSAICTSKLCGASARVRF